MNPSNESMKALTEKAIWSGEPDPGDMTGLDPFFVLRAFVFLLGFYLLDSTLARVGELIQRGMNPPWLLWLAALGGVGYYSIGRRYSSAMGWRISYSIYIGGYMLVVLWLYAVVYVPFAPAVKTLLSTLLTVAGYIGYQRIWGQRDSAALVDGIARWTSAIDSDPAVAANYSNRGNFYLEFRDYERALADFSRAIALDPDDAVAFNNRGLLLHNSGAYDAALADFSRAIELNSDYAQAYNNRGLVYTAQGDHDRAIDDYSRAIELAPTSPYPYHNRALNYARKGDFPSAFADLDHSWNLAGCYLTREAGLLARRRGRLLPPVDRPPDIPPIERVGPQPEDKPVKWKHPFI